MQWNSWESAYKPKTWFQGWISGVLQDLYTLIWGERNKGNSEAAVSEVGAKSKKILGSLGKKMLPETGWSIMSEASMF